MPGIEDMRGAGEFDMDQHAVPTYELNLTPTQMAECDPRLSQCVAR